MAPVGGGDLIAERKDTDEALVETSGQATRLVVDENGYLKVTMAGGVGSTRLGGYDVTFTHDLHARAISEETLGTLRAILNHLRAMTTGQQVDESAPVQGAN